MGLPSRRSNFRTSKRRTARRRKNCSASCTNPRGALPLAANLPKARGSPARCGSSGRNRRLPAPRAPPAGAARRAQSLFEIHGRSVHEQLRLRVHPRVLVAQPKHEAAVRFGRRRTQHDGPVERGIVALTIDQVAEAAHLEQHSRRLALRALGQLRVLQSTACFGVTQSQRPRVFNQNIHVN